MLVLLGGQGSVSNRTVHEEVCRDLGDDFHNPDEEALEACYGCEEIVTCRESFLTGDPDSPVICKECKF